MNTEELKNNRPIANVRFFAKILEKLAASQLQAYLKENYLYAKFQSGYRQFYGFETALLRVTNEILMSLDKGEEVILILLDFSSAFDTINHDILLKRLEHKLGICDQALKWFQSYLLGRSHRVIIGNERSFTHSLTQGVPQGSVLGPFLFTLYICPPESIIDRYHIQKMFYADDTQLYVSFKKSNDFDPTTENLNCIHAIKEWSQLNSLKLNNSKQSSSTFLLVFEKRNLFSL